MSEVDTNISSLLGLDRTIIEYDTKEMLWKLTEQSKGTIGSTEAPLESYVMGAHDWVVENDNVKCSRKGETYHRILKLTGCREGEFTCNDGQCIRTIAHVPLLKRTINFVL